MTDRTTLRKFIGDERGAQSDFATKAGITRGHMKNILTGTRIPDDHDTGKFADIMGLTGEKRKEFIRSSRIARLKSDKEHAPLIKEMEDEMGRLEDLAASLVIALNSPGNRLSKDAIDALKALAQVTKSVGI